MRTQEVLEVALELFLAEVYAVAAVGGLHREERLLAVYFLNLHALVEQRLSLFGEVSLQRFGILGADDDVLLLGPFCGERDRELAEEVLVVGESLDALVDNLVADDVGDFALERVQRLPCVELELALGVLVELGGIARQGGGVALLGEQYWSKPMMSTRLSPG